MLLHYIFIHRYQIAFDYKIDHVILGSVTNVRDLGIEIDSKT